MLGQKLLELCTTLGISPERTKSYETPDRFELQADVLVRLLRDASAATIRGAATAFGAALGLSIEVEGIPILRVHAGTSPGDLEESWAGLAALPDDMTLHVGITVDKQALLQRMTLDLNHWDATYYLFLDNLVRLLAAPLPELETVLFPQSRRPALVVVSDAGVLCRGPFLVVAGEDGFGDAKDFLEVPHSATWERAERLQRLAAGALNWAGFGLRRLTPLHFQCDWVRGDDQTLRRALANRLLQLTIVYTANRSEAEGAQIRATYSGSERSACVVTSETRVSQELVSELTELLGWLQEGAERDKIMLFQNVVAREIGGDDGHEGFRALVERMCALMRDVRWHHRIYLDGRINKHFEQVEALGQGVADACKGVSEIIDAVTKGCVDALLGSVAVVILSLLASLAKNETQGVVFRAGMWSYAVYLLVFPLCYRMFDLSRRYSIAVKEWGLRRAWFEAALGREKVEELSAPLRERKHHFRLMFVATLILYGVVIALVVWAGLSLPPALAGLGSPGATPPPGPMASPTPTA